MILKLLCSCCHKEIAEIDNKKELSKILVSNIHLCDDCNMLQQTRVKVREAFLQWNSLGRNVPIHTHYEKEYVYCPICHGEARIVGGSTKQVFCSFCHGYFYNTGLGQEWVVYLEGQKINYNHSVWVYYPYSKFEQIEKIKSSKKLDEIYVQNVYQKLKDLGL